jgi:integrase
MRRCVSDWLDRPLKSITKDDIAKRHKVLSETPAQANQVMRVLRAVYAFAIHKYDDIDGNPLITHNPVNVLSGTRAWNKDRIGTCWVPPHEMSAWFEAVSRLQDPFKDYFTLLVLTGLRMNEARTLQWCDVNFRDRTITVRNTKNSDDHQLPMSGYLFDLLRQRYDAAQSLETWSESACNGKRAGRYQQQASRKWVFGAGIGNGSCISVGIIQHRPVPGAPPFTPHALRRTFLTTAAGLNLSGYIIKQLANHRVSNSDVTQRYIARNVEMLREPMQRITDEILRQAGLSRTDEKAKPQAKQQQSYSSLQYAQCTTNITVSGFEL